MIPKPTFMFDVELYRDYFLAGFLNLETGEVRQFEAVGETGHLSQADIAAIRQILARYRVVTFNGKRYDMVVLSPALSGMACLPLKRISDKIIKAKMLAWQMEIELPKCDHIDVFDVAPGVASLKIYGGRLHCQKMQDLPIDEAASISPEDRVLLRTYNVNDLINTGALWTHLQPQLDLREQMSKTYGIDLRSKSDAQIAEAVIVKEVSAVQDVKRPEVLEGTRFHYAAPPFVQFQTEPLREALALVHRQEFVVTDKGSVQMPEELKRSVIAIGAQKYKIGIGGLHSQEKTVSYYADDDTELTDTDVQSYYPAIIINNNISPPHLGSAFMRSFRPKKDQRIAAKNNGDKITSETLKIVLNGAGGKLNQKWSKLYYPQGFIKMVLTGQLALLMLIEALEIVGVRVVSANTDGVALLAASRLCADRDRVITEWERLTGFKTETKQYRSLHIHSVNSYIAIYK